MTTTPNLPSPPTISHAARMAQNAVSDNPYYRLGAARDPATPTHLLVHLFNNAAGAHHSLQDAVIRFAVLSNPSAPLDLILRVLQNPVTGADRDAICRNPALPTNIIAQEIDTILAVRANRSNLEHYPNWLALLSLPNCPTEVLRTQGEFCVARGYSATGTAIAANRHCPDDVQVTLTKHPYYAPRVELATNPNLCEDALELLETDRSARVTIALLNKGYRSPQLLEHARQSTKATVLQALLYADLADDRVETAAVESTSPLARTAAARKVTDPDKLVGLALDRRYQVRSAVLRNPVCPDEAKVAAALLK